MLVHNSLNFHNLRNWTMKHFVASCIFSGEKKKMVRFSIVTRNSARAIISNLGEDGGR